MLLTKVVVKVELFQCTFEPETKFDPLTVSVKPGPPAVALLGEIELIAGTGLLTVNVFGGCAAAWARIRDGHIDCSTRGNVRR